MGKTIVDDLIVALLIEFAGAVIFMMIQSRLEDWKKTKPYVLPLLTMLIIVAIGGLLFLSNAISGIGIQQREIRVPVPFFTGRYFELPTPRISLWSALSISGCVPPV